MPRSQKFPDFPSVTEILSDLGLTADYRHVPEEARVKAMARGKGLHRALELHRHGRLDRASLHPELAGPFEAALRFNAEWLVKPIPGSAEVELVDTRLQVVGHIDDAVECTDPASGAFAIALLDYKLTDGVDLRGATLQLAGYRCLWNGDHIDRCLVVQFLKSGEYKVIDVTDDYAMTEFKAALVVYRAKRRTR